MNVDECVHIFSSTFGRGVFPHQMTWILDIPGRGLIMSAKTLANRLPVSPSARVLEVGAGSGYYSVEVAKKLFRGRLDLLDIQGEMLDKCKRRLDSEKLTNCGLHVGDAKKLPFIANVFDAIYMVTVFGEIESQTAFLKEASRVLKPNGILSITEHHPDPDFEPFSTLKKIVQSQGFTLLQKLGWRWAYTSNFLNQTETAD